MKAIRRRWLLAVETECDRAAVRAGFPEALVARTILKLKRENQGRLAQAPVIHYASSDADALRTRLEVLLNRPTEDSRIGGVWILLPVFWLLSLLFFPQVHHAMETFLGWLG